MVPEAFQKVEYLGLRMLRGRMYEFEGLRCQLELGLQRPKTD